MANKTGLIEINGVQYDFAKLLVLKSYAHVEAVTANACILNGDCRDIPPGSEPLAVEVVFKDKKVYIVFARNQNQLLDLSEDNTKMVKVLIYSKFGLKKAKPENATVEPAYEQERPRYNEGRHEGRYQGNSNYQGGYSNNQGYQGNRPRFAGEGNRNDNTPPNPAPRTDPIRPPGTFQQQQPARSYPQRTGSSHEPDPRSGNWQPKQNRP